MEWAHNIKRLFLGSLGILGIASMVGVVSAADTMDGQATLTVVAPKDALSLKTTPNIDFGSATIGNINGEISGTTDNPYTIIDLRGGSTGYRVQVESGPFTLKTDSSKVLPVTSMTMKVANSTNGQLTGTSSDVNIYGQQAVLVTGGVDSNGTQISGNVTSKLTLDATKVGSLKVGEYRANVTHSIVSGVQ